MFHTPCAKMGLTQPQIATAIQNEGFTAFWLAEIRNWPYLLDYHISVQCPAGCACNTAQSILLLPWEDGLRTVQVRRTILTPWSRAPDICLKGICQHCFQKCLGAIQAPTYFLNQCWQLGTPKQFWINLFFIFAYFQCNKCHWNSSLIFSV